MFDCNKNNTILIIFISNFLFISEQLKKKKRYSLLKQVINDRKMKIHIHNVYNFHTTFMISQFTYGET